MKARSQAKPKRYRRYDSSGLSGALEALPRPRVRHASAGGKWIALALIALLVVGAILWIWLSDTFYVTRIGVAGNALTSAQEIVQISGIGGQHMLWVNHAAASERIANGIPSIKSARVDCQLPDRCVIKVQERQPSVAWRFGGAVTWIAEMAWPCRAAIRTCRCHDRGAWSGAAARRRPISLLQRRRRRQSAAECAPVQIHRARVGISERARIPSIPGPGR
jgi:hypothetical protein